MKKFQPLSLLTKLKTTILTAMIVLFSVSIYAQTEISVPFPQGFIGTKGSNPQQANNITTFATLGITRAFLTQTNTSGAFELQGNDISCVLKLQLISGQIISIPGAIVWRETSGSTIRLFGFIPSSTIAPISFTYGGTSTCTINNTSNIGLNKIGSSLALTNGISISGNAATAGLIDDLNAYLALTIANKPAGPVTVTPLTTNDTTPIITGTATLSAGQTLSIIFNNTLYTSANGLVINGSNWSLLIANSLPIATYTVTATITSSAGYILNDATTNELILVSSCGGDIFGSGYLTSPISSTVRDNNWTVVALPQGYTSTEALPYKAYVVQTSILPGYVNKSGYTDVNGKTFYWIAPNTNANSILGGTYNWIVQQTFTVPNSGFYDVKFSGAGDNAIAFFINGTVDKTDAINPVITGGTQIGTRYENFGAIGIFTGKVFLNAGVNKAFMILYDWVGATAAIISGGEFSCTPVINGPNGDSDGISSISIPENTTNILSYSSNKQVTWALSGEDAAKFTITPNGVLTFKVAPDFKAPTDGPTNGYNTYTIIITATGTDGKISSQALTVSITSADTDGDGVTDDIELIDQTDPNDACKFILADQNTTPSTAWNNADCDADGINNGQEKINGTDPLVKLLDTDNDGIPDATDTDDDGDGILDTDELDCSASTGVSQTLNPTTFNYVTWNSLVAGVLRGTINTGSTIVNVTVTNSSNSIINYGSTPYCGTTYWSPLPVGNGGAGSFRSYTLGEHKFVFDQPVNNPRFFLSSLNRILDLSAPGTMLKSNGAFTGFPVGTTGTVLPGDEACGTLSFTGNVSEVSFTGRESEYYCDFSLGIAGLANYGACVDQDTDGDGIPDRLDLDSDGDGVTDQQEVTDGTNPRVLCSFVLAHQTLTPSATWNSTDCDGDGLSNGTEKTKESDPLVKDFAPVITGPNGSGTITGAISAKSIPENTNAVYTFTVTKPVTWSLTGEDANKFTITPSGVLTFVNPPLFGNPTDGSTAGTNSYVVVITGTDHIGLATSQTLTVYIKDPTCNQFASSDFIINGNASLSGNEITLTPNAGSQSGSVWNQYKLSLNKDFNISTKVYLGNSDGGADGLAFVLQNQSINAGSSGGGLGYAGINPSFAVEFDTYNNGGQEPIADHIALIKNGATGSIHNGIANAVPFETEMEDGQWHDVRFLWNATNKNFQVYYDNVKRFDITYDLKANIFPNTDYVFWGFTGATGGATNLQKVQLPEYCYVQQASITLKTGTNNALASKSFCVGGDVVLESSLATSYQWYKDGAIITGATNRSLTASQNGSYTVETLSLSFTTVSEPVVVTVNLIPAISYPNTNYSFIRGDAITNLIATNTVAVNVSTYTIAPALPTGLSINSANGTISGTPTATKVATAYVVTATSTSGCANTYTVNLVVINDTPPSALSYSPTPQTLRKNFVMTNMLPTATGGKVITYTISPTLPAGIIINSTTGIISGTLTTTLTGSQEYTITATNSGGFTTANVTLIFNSPPTDISISTDKIDENRATNATVGLFSTTDPDTGDTFTYTLVSGTGSTDNASFTISGNTLKANAAFNFESKTSYSILVRSTDAGGLFYEKAFTISVLNVNETPTNITLSANSINENNAISSSIGTLSTTDVDAGDTFTYTLVSGTGSTDNASFTISANTLKANAAFNFEAKISYSILVRTTDAGGLFFDKAFTISVLNVNETPTDIALGFTAIYENNAVGATIGNLSSTDVDAGDTFTYTLVSGDVSAFNIVGNKLNAAMKFDYNTKTSYTIVIKTTDAGGLSYQKTFTINILKAPVATGIGNEAGTNTITAASNNVTISKGFSAQLNVTGSQLVTYSWSPSTGLNTTTSATPIANPTVTTTYAVTVTNSMGLSTVVYVTVTVLEDYNIKPYNMVTPNDDGINDKWVIENINQYPNNEVVIFDRAGRKIYSKKGYQNDWDGKYNGQDLAVDTYYYIINFGTGIEPRKGFISIIRSY